MRDHNSRLKDSESLKTKLALTRISRWHDIAPDSVNMVRAELMHTLGLNQPETSAGMRMENTPQTSADANGQLSAQTRHIIHAGAPWHVVASALWSDFQRAPSLTKAARLLEIAFVEASPAETLEIFTRLMISGQKGFYWYLHPKLRDFIIEHAPEQHLDQLYWTIAKERDDSKLSGIELTYIFLRVATTSDKTAAWMYFRRHQERIIGAFSQSKHFGMSKTQLMFRAGELALSLGYNPDARDIFHALPVSTPERDTGLQLLLRFESNTLDRDRNSYFIRVENATSWQERLAIIASFCDAARGSRDTMDQNRPALDLLLKSLLQWVPKNSEAWRAVGDLIVRHRDLSPLLPSLLTPLIDQTVAFHGPDFDGALWNAAQSMRPQTSTELFLNGVALIHKYVTNPRLGESLLWQATELLLKLESSAVTMPWTYREILKSGQQWIKQSTVLVDRDRKRAAASLRLALEGTLASETTVDTYLALCTPIPDTLLLGIANNAIAGGQQQFASRILARSGLHRAFTNKQLLQMWGLAANSETPDLAWRISTVLAARDALPENIRHLWDISGEHRSAYQPVSPTQEDIDAALDELSVSAKKLVKALCLAGTKINELAQIRESSSHASPCMNGVSSIEQSIVESLKNNHVIPKPTKIIVETTGIHMAPDAAASLAQAIISSPWLFSARLIAERLSATSWGWSVDVLHHLAKSVVTLIGKDPNGRGGIKLSRWLGSLSSLERAAWNDLITCSIETTPEALSVELVKFTCRLAVIVYPGHLTALKTLHQLRPPIEIIRDLEWFILSDSLTQVRKRHNIQARIAVSEILKKEYAKN